MHVGVDVGGTKVLAVALGATGGDPEVVASSRLPMPGRDASEEELEDTIARVVLDVTGGETPAGIGVAAAGLVDHDGERYLFGAHLPWRDAPVRARLDARLGAAVVLDNDANCAAYAELVAGTLRGVPSGLLVTVGTGLGGAVVLDGRLVRGAHGIAGEFGHIKVVPDGLECECGLRGCWEQYCSGRALEREARGTLGADIAGPAVADLARNGTPAAVRAFATVGTWLGAGLAGLVSALDPDLVVVGGGVSAVGDLLLDPARSSLVDSLQATAQRAVPPIVPAHFGSAAGAVGAALLSAGPAGRL